MNRRRTGMGVYMLMLVAIAVVWLVATFSSKGTVDYSYAKFKEALADGEVVSVEIAQNSSTPTGNVYVTLQNGDVGLFSVPDVTELQAYLDEQDFDQYIFDDVPKQSWWVSYLPTLIILVAIILFWVSSNNQMMAASGGGAAE